MDSQNSQCKICLPPDSCPNHSCQVNLDEFHPCLNVETRKYEENSQGGLMICGMNWGGEQSLDPKCPSNAKKPPTFFSDTTNAYEYKDKIVDWFGYFGHPLKRVKEEARRFEKSILQTNWLTHQSKDTTKIKYPVDYVAGWENFERRLIALNPKLIIFLSVSLLDVFNSYPRAPRGTKLDSSQRVPRGSKLYGAVQESSYWGSNGKSFSEPYAFGFWVCRCAAEESSKHFEGSIHPLLLIDGSESVTLDAGNEENHEYSLASAA